MKRVVFLLAILLPLAGKTQVFYADGMQFRVNTDGKAVVVGYKKDAYLGVLNVPKVVEYQGTSYDVVEIESYAFNNCQELGYITIPFTIEKIGNAAFRGCTNLDVAEFIGCTPVHGPKEIGDYAFAETGLLTFHVPSSVTKLGGFVFYKCKKLSSLLGLFGLEKIPVGMCRGCEKLIAFHIPTNIKKIEDYAFAECDFHTVRFPHSIEALGYYIFQGNRNITKVTARMFDPCSLPESSFDADIYDRCLLAVPIGYFQIYKNKEYWNKFINVREEEDDEEDETSVGNIQGGSKAQATYYSIDGKRFPSAQKGLNIVKTADGRTKKVNVKMK